MAPQGCCSLQPVRGSVGAHLIASWGSTLPTLRGCFAAFWGPDPQGGLRPGTGVPVGPEPRGAGRGAGVPLLPAALACAACVCYCRFGSQPVPGQPPALWVQYVQCTPSQVCHRAGLIFSLIWQGRGVGGGRVSSPCTRKQPRRIPALLFIKA